MHANTRNCAEEMMEDLQAFVRVDHAAHASDMQHSTQVYRPLLDALASRTPSNASQASANLSCVLPKEWGGSVSGLSRELGVERGEGMHRNPGVPPLAAAAVASPVSDLDLSMVDEAPRNSGPSLAPLCLCALVR